MLLVWKLFCPFFRYYKKLQNLVNKKYHLRQHYPLQRELFQGDREYRRGEENNVYFKPLFNETESDDCMLEVLGDDS